MTKVVKAFAPASIGNVTVGFDVLGLALSKKGDTITLVENQHQTNRITSIKNGNGIPTDLTKNSCSVVIAEMQKHLNSKLFVDISIEKGFKSGSGLGSSSASSVAAAFAYNELIGSPFTQTELAQFASYGEQAACGTAHLDNVLPALLGGLVVNFNNSPFQLQLPDSLNLLILYPDITINTEDSRKVLKQPSIQSCTQQVGNMAAFIHAIHTNNVTLLKESLRDVIAEPYRKQLLPNFDRFKDYAMHEGAIHFGISGSGPTMFCLAENIPLLKRIQSFVVMKFQEDDIAVTTWIEESANNTGAKILT